MELQTISRFNDLLDFCVTGKRNFSEGDLFAPPTQDYSNLLQDLFFCYVLIEIEGISKSVGDKTRTREKRSLLFGNEFGLKKINRSY